MMTRLSSNGHPNRLFGVWLLGWVVYFSQMTHAEVIKQDPVLEKATLKIELVDGDGQRIANAMVRPYALRCVEEPSTHFFWPVKEFGEAPLVTSNSEGIVEIPYPAKWMTSGSRMTTSQLSITIYHTEFISKQVDLDLAIAQPPIELQAGCEVSITVKDPQGESNLNFGILMAGPGASAPWASQPPSTRRSRSIPPGTWQALIASPQPDGVTLFSGVIPIRLRTSQSATLRNVPLKPGMRLSGKLSENVPRPVEDGIVLAFCTPKPIEAVAGERPDVVRWATSTSIQADGSFTFASLPDSGNLQLIALAKGWIIQCEERSKNQWTVGQLLTADEARESMPIILPMEETGDLAVRLVDPKGEPVIGATIETWPNQFVVGAGSTILGKRWDTLERIEAMIQSRPLELPKQNGDRFTSVTDKHGIAILRNLPIGTGLALTVIDSNYRLPTREDRLQDFPYRLLKPGITEIQIAVEEIPK
ncbi:MAG: hypothetical protein U0905_08205 [Pirellulales bacterium]